MRAGSLFSLVVVLGACGTETQLVEGQHVDGAFIAIDEPLAASFHSEGSVSVTGRMAHAEGLTVNDGPATVDGDTFSAAVDLERGVNLVEAAGTDPDGERLFHRVGVLAGEWGDPERRIYDAMAVRIGVDGLQDILGGVGGLLDDEFVETALLARNPLLDDTIQISGFQVADVRVDLVGLSYGPLDLWAEAGDGALYLENTVPDLVIEVQATGNVGGLVFDESVDLWADEMVVTGDLTVDTDSGELEAKLDHTTVEFTNLGFDASLLPDSIEEDLLVQPVVDILEGVLALQLSVLVPQAVADHLSELAVDVQTEVLDTPLSIQGTFSHANLDAEGLDLGMHVAVDMPSTGWNDAPGYLAAPEAEPTLDPTADMSVAVSDDLLNRVLFEAWDAHLLSLYLSTEDETLDPIALTSLGSSRGSLRIDAMLPPVIVGHAGNPQVQIAELRMVIETPGGDYGEHVEASVALFADVLLGVQDHTLKLAFGEPRMVVQVHSSDWGETNEAISSRLEHLLPVDMLLDVLGQIEVPLPDIGGMEIEQATVSRDPSDTHTGVDLTLR